MKQGGTCAAVKGVGLSVYAWWFGVYQGNSRQNWCGDKLRQTLLNANPNANLLSVKERSCCPLTYLAN